MTFAALQYPTIIRESNFVTDLASDAFWPDDAGPIEKILNLADWGTWFMGPSVVMITMLAGMMGYDFRTLGKWLDTTLKLKTFEDLSNISLNGALDSILGKLSPEMKNELQAEGVRAGIINGDLTSSTSKLFPLVKLADDAASQQALTKEQLKARQQWDKEATKDPKVQKMEKAHSELMNKTYKSTDGGDLSRKQQRAIDKSSAKLKNAKLLANEREMIRRQTGLRNMFGEAGKRSTTAKHAFKNKGFLGGLLTTFTTSLGYLKDVAKKVLSWGVKGKTGLALKMILGGSTAYAAWKFSSSGDAEPQENSKVGINKNMYTEGVSKDIEEAGSKRGLGKQAPKSLGGKLALQVDLVISEKIGR